MLNPVKIEVEKILRQAKIAGDILLSEPPKANMGDLAFACFSLAKQQGLSPADVALSLKSKVQSLKSTLVERVEAFGPYVNFYLNATEAAKIVLGAITEQGINFGKAHVGDGQKVMVEFAHPNTHKAFHIGHLRNLITGESLVRIFANAGYEVIRANYQGDIGLHIAKCLYGIVNLKKQGQGFGELATLNEKINFLGKAYAAGAKAYEGDEQAKEDITDYNKKIYNKDETIWHMYSTTRAWSLEYFDKIYTRLGSHFDRLFFESEMFERAKQIVANFTAKGVFKESQGAVIFEGSKYGYHDRVFLTGEGLPTYEAKDMALAEKQFADYNPDHIYHLVATEQIEYFNVIIKALELILPISRGREHHLVYGWVRLKDGKMSSRTGQVVLGEWLLDEAKKSVLELMKQDGADTKDLVAERVAIAAVKYSMLKTGIGNDITFNIKEAVSLTGDSGPYLLYICARIKSILRKLQANEELFNHQSQFTCEPTEKQLLIHLGNFSEITEAAVTNLDPSLIARYLFLLAQRFNDFYEACPVLKSSGAVRALRLQIIRAVLQVAEQALYLLGIETVEEM